MKLAKGFNVHVSVILLLGMFCAVYAELRLLMSVFRHGDRYPMRSNISRLIYPLNPHANVSWFPDCPEALTIKGKRRAYELGTILRDRYGEWLGPIYSKKFVEFRSSNTRRAITTSTLVATGLFPPSGEQRWNSKLNWQPIPISPVPKNETVLHFGILCAKYRTLFNKVAFKDPIMVKYNNAMKDFYKRVSRNTGGPVNNRILYFLYIEFLTAEENGLELPKWTEGIFPEGEMKEAAMIDYIFTSWTDELKRYTGGVWLQKWFGHVNNYLSDEENNGAKKKAFFYGGHDINIAGIMATMGIFYRHIPNYTSAVNFELHEDEKGRFYVKVLHRNSGEFTAHVIPGCGNVFCPLETLKKIFANVIPNGPLECGDQDFVVDM